MPLIGLSREGAELGKRDNRSRGKSFGASLVTSSRTAQHSTRQATTTCRYVAELLLLQRSPRQSQSPAATARVARVVPPSDLHEALPSAMATIEATSGPVVADPSISVPDFLKTSPIFSRFASAYIAFSERREALGLTNPGTVDNIAKEVQRDVFTNNLMFTGLRADLTKAFSMSPLFQVSHSLSMGSQMLPPYALAAIYGSPRVSLTVPTGRQRDASGLR